MTVGDGLPVHRHMVDKTVASRQVTRHVSQRDPVAVTTAGYRRCSSRVEAIEARSVRDRARAARRRAVATGPGRPVLCRNESSSAIRSALYASQPRWTRKTADANSRDRVTLIVCCEVRL